MEKPTRFTFSNGRTAQAVWVQLVGELLAALRELGLRGPHLALVLMGGASKMDSEGLGRLRLLFAVGLVRPVAALGAALIDGGTDTGVMRLMGQVRATLDSTFPLLGVAAIGTVVFS
jgi:hypothetical protein